MATRMVVVVGVLLGLASAEAAAQTPSREELLRGAVRRARRGYAVGVTAGAGAAWNPDAEADAVDVPISFGLSFRKYDIPVVPDPQALKDKFEQRVRAKVDALKEQYVREGKPPPDESEMRRLGMEILREVQADILRELDVPPKLVEDPSYAVDLEGQYFTKAEAGAVRLTVGVGISKVTIGPTIALVIADDVGLTLGGELATRLMPGKGPRSPNIDLFVRGDFGVAGIDGTVVTFGGRILLDII